MEKGSTEGKPETFLRGFFYCMLKLFTKNDWRTVPYEQEIFIKFMVEDKNFLFQTHKIDQNEFTVRELRDIVRTIKDMSNAGEEITYETLRETLRPRYAGDDESKEISWMIIEAVLDECASGVCLNGVDEDKCKKHFIKYGEV